MKYKVLDNYNRRGKRIWIALELSDFGVMHTNDGEDYTESYVSIGFELIDGKFTYIDEDIVMNDTYPVSEELDREHILEILNSSTVAQKALKQIKSK
ncbi:hypothetical protein ACI2JA_03895 [Alkalihalobacillus sp. NPDC078783]